jgi:GxxExxY protein
LWGLARYFEDVARHKLLEEGLTRSVIGAFFEVYNTLGFGFLEHVYVMAMERELIARASQVRKSPGLQLLAINQP